MQHEKITVDDVQIGDRIARAKTHHFTRVIAINEGQTSRRLALEYVGEDRPEWARNREGHDDAGNIRPRRTANVWRLVEEQAREAINEPNPDGPVRFQVGDVDVWARTQAHAEEIALRWRCDRGDVEACAELDRRGVEPEEIDVVALETDAHCEDLTDLQVAVRDALATEFASVEVRQEGPVVSLIGLSDGVVGAFVTVDAVTDGIVVESKDPSGVYWAGRKFGELSPAERQKVQRYTAGRLETELRQNAPAIAEVLEGS